MHLLYRSKSACASRGELLAGRLVFSPGTCYSIISPRRCSDGGQQSATVVLLFTSTYGAENRCQMLPPPSGPIITPSLSLPVCSLRTRADWNEAEPSPSDIAWILCILWWANYLQTRFLWREAELWRAFGFLEQHTFSNQIRLNDRSS